MFPSDDPLDNPAFDSVSYINEVFPNEQALTKLEDFVAKLKGQIRRYGSAVAAVALVL